MATATRVVLIIEYDGTDYYGFQWQSGQPTIQSELEAAIERLTDRWTRVVSASRTDTGVHARGQVVTFRTESSLPTERLVSGLNHYLPQDIAVRAAYRVADSFHVQREAPSREYDYRILNRRARSPILRRFAHLVPVPLDTGAMNKACELLLGEHDFASFASDMEPGRQGTVKVVYQARVERDGEMVTYNVVANSFLPHQVRNTVGVLIRVGLERLEVSEVRGIMEARKPGLAGPTAPACGLCLVKVNYPVPFEERVNENL